MDVHGYMFAPRYHPALRQQTSSAAYKDWAGHEYLPCFDPDCRQKGGARMYHGTEGIHQLAMGAAAIMGFLILVAVAFCILWVYVVVDIMRSEFTVPTNKIVWLLLVLFVGPLGITLYYFIGRDQRANKTDPGTDLPHR